MYLKPICVLAAIAFLGLYFLLDFIVSVLTGTAARNGNAQNQTNGQGPLFSRQADHSRGKAIIFCHGFPRFQQSCQNALNLFHENGFDTYWLRYFNARTVLSIMPEETLMRDIRNLWDMAISDGFDPEDIIIVGYSLGGSAAALLAQSVNARLLVLAATPTSLAAAFRRDARTFTASFGAIGSHDTSGIASTLVNTNLLLVFATRDANFTDREGRILLGQYQGFGRSDFLIVRDAEHDQVFDFSRRALIQAIIRLS